MQLHRLARGWALLILAWCFSVCEARAARILAQDGATRYRVVTPASPSGADALAARELAAFLKQSTGAEFAIVTESELPADVPGLYVGQTEFAERQGIDFASFGREESLTRTVGDDIVFCGGQPRGALHAVYDFLEKEVGCRWLDEKTEVVPKLDVLEIGRLKVRRQPAFWYRDVYTAQHRYWGGGGGRFVLRNKGSHGVPEAAAIPHHGSPGGCHTFYAYSKDWPDKPELFSLNLQGDRDRAASGSGPGHFCVTNPESIRLVLVQLRKFIAKNRVKKGASGLYPRVYDIS